jgi:hypothetical protein
LFSLLKQRYIMNIVKVFLIDRRKDVLDQSICPIIQLKNIIGVLFFHRVDLIFNIHTIFHAFYNSISITTWKIFIWRQAPRRIYLYNYKQSITLVYLKNIKTKENFINTINTKTYIMTNLTWDDMYVPLHNAHTSNNVFQLFSLQVFFF